MAQRDIFVVGTAGTAIGTFGGSLEDVPNTQLASTAVKAAIEHKGVAVIAIGYWVMRQVELLGGSLFRDARAGFMAP